jgi:hypothetical protein
MADNFPSAWGMKFTPTIHSKAEGPTDPKNNQLPANFVVVVTGAGKGLGYHISLAYATAGAKGIAIASRTHSDLDKLETELKRINPALEVLKQACDTTKDADVKALADATQEKFGRIDVVVSSKPFPGTSLAPPPELTTSRCRLQTPAWSPTTSPRMTEKNICRSASRTTISNASSTRT